MQLGNAIRRLNKWKTPGGDSRGVLVGEYNVHFKYNLLNNYLYKYLHTSGVKLSNRANSSPK